MPVRKIKYSFIQHPFREDLFTELELKFLKDIKTADNLRNLDKNIFAAVWNKTFLYRILINNHLPRKFYPIHSVITARETFDTFNDVLLYEFIRWLHITIDTYIIIPFTIEEDEKFLALFE